MLNSVKIAQSRMVAVDKENAEAKRKAKVAAAREQAAKKRKEEQEAEQRTWDEKKGRLEDNTREIQEEIMNENESLMAAVSRG
jgi:phage I-like protein